MSLVGPKAESPEYVATYRGIVPLYNRRFNIRPGITGWAQVRWRYGDNVEDVIEKTKYDLYYLDHVSPALDLWIILASVKRLIKGIKG
jgi:lipopolysaccharide/colanic/teichoic acid biosynthesis glycosyltransferase